MTERGRNDIFAENTNLIIGPSRVRYCGDALVAEIDERASPIPRRAKGTIRIHPRSVNPDPFRLDYEGRHIWHPVVPSARVELKFSTPDIAWSGEGYVDMNHGSEALEEGFRHWNWSRSCLTDRAVVFYEGALKDGEPFGLSLSFAPDGTASSIPAPMEQPLARTIWLLPRWTRTDRGTKSKIARTLEDTPFYSRTILDSRLFGETVKTMHESVDLNRFSARWTQALLPYRMPRKPTG